MHCKHIIFRANNATKVNGNGSQIPEWEKRNIWCRVCSRDYFSQWEWIVGTMLQLIRKGQTQTYLFELWVLHLCLQIA